MCCFSPMFLQGSQKTNITCVDQHKYQCSINAVDRYDNKYLKRSCNALDPDNYQISIGVMILGGEMFDHINLARRGRSRRATTTILLGITGKPLIVTEFNVIHTGDYTRYLPNLLGPTSLK